MNEPFEADSEADQSVVSTNSAKCGPPVSVDSLLTHVSSQDRSLAQSPYVAEDVRLTFLHLVTYITFIPSLIQTLLSTTLSILRAWTQATRSGNGCAWLKSSNG